MSGLRSQRPAAELRVHEDLDGLFGDCASWFLARLEAAQAAGREPNVGLTGGSLASDFHAEVVRRAPASTVDFSRVVFWWGDERFVASDDPDRNDLAALTSLLEPLGVPASQIHRVPAADEVPDVAAAADAYGTAIRTHGAGEFEVVLFGLGPDGHVASLFPHHRALDIADAIAVPVTRAPKPPPERVSLTFEAFERSRAVAFLVSGEAKADAVARAWSDGPVSDCPARGVAGQEETVWFTDSLAARSLA